MIVLGQPTPDLPVLHVEAEMRAEDGTSHKPYAVVLIREMPDPFVIRGRQANRT
jgi:hypothetical protein